MFNVLVVLCYLAAVAAFLGILDRILDPECTEHHHGRRCNVHNGSGEWS